MGFTGRLGALVRAVIREIPDGRSGQGPLRALRLLCLPARAAGIGDLHPRAAIRRGGKEAALSTSPHPRVSTCAEPADTSFSLVPGTDLRTLCPSCTLALETVLRFFVPSPGFQQSEWVELVPMGIAKADTLPVAWTACYHCWLRTESQGGGGPQTTSCLLELDVCDVCLPICALQWHRCPLSRQLLKSGLALGGGPVQLSLVLAGSRPLGPWHLQTCVSSFTLTEGPLGFSLASQ